MDPDARHTRKSPEARRDGYRAHVAADPQTGIITDEKLTKAAGQDNSDPAVAEEYLAREAASGQDSGGAGGPLAWYGGSAYGTGDLRDAVGKAGHWAVIKPKPVRPPVQGGFTLHEFTVNPHQGTVTCPAGVTRPITASRNVTFGAACRGCPLREQCTTSKTGRTLILHEHDDLLRAARRDWAASSQLRVDYMTHRAQRGTRHRPSRHLAGTPAQAALPRHRQKQRLAQAPHRRAEPEQPDRPRPGPPRRRLGAGHLTRPTGQIPSVAGSPPDQATPIAGLARPPRKRPDRATTAAGTRAVYGKPTETT